MLLFICSSRNEYISFKSYFEYSEHFQRAPTWITVSRTVLVGLRSKLQCFKTHHAFLYSYSLLLALERDYVSSSVHSRICKSR